MIASPARGLPTVRLGAFVALAAFASAYWLSLLADPPVARACVAVAVVAGGGSLLALIGRTPLGSLPRTALAAAVFVASTAAALAAIGVPTSTLAPGGWDRLGAGIDRGLEGLGGDVEFPYAGAEQWSRLIMLAGLVCLLALAAALTFWPRRAPRSGARIGGLATLIAVYAAAAAMRSGPEPLIAGLFLLLLAAAWLWLPSLSRGGALITTIVVAGLGVLALPIAGALEARPWLDYRDWRLAVPSDPRSFVWDHSYGPLGPRDGTPLLGVRSAERHYWRAAVLDRFDGYTWGRSRTDVGQSPLELPTAVDRRSAAGAPERLNPDWIVRTEFTLRELKSPFAIAPGALRSTDGIEIEPTPNGTAVVEDGALADGDVYTAVSYAPNPTADEMRRAPDAYAPALAHHTTIGLPRAEPPEGPPGGGFGRPVVVPLRGADAGGHGAAGRLARSGYGEVFELARRLTEGAPSTYDAVKAIEMHLQSSYDYVEEVRVAGMPLRVFLFQSRAGYCEQFSGAMALMLRMLGIPARVAAGFSPGRPDGPDRYVVRDREAHSWVEVYFTGIGWVPFDPTPAIAPAELQLGGSAAASAAGGGASAARPRTAAVPAPVRPAGPGSTGGVPAWPFALAIALPLIAGIALTVVRRLRHRSLSAADAAEAGTEELAAALERLGWPLRPRFTLSRVEDVMRAARCPSAAAYAASLRAVRFGRDGWPPSLSERRRVRRELRRFPGWRATFGSYRAIPPGAPRRPRPLKGQTP
jgi:protein-glutamine gamma-glutamyltransferase